MQSYYAMGVAQYKVADDHLFAALKGAPCRTQDLSVLTTHIACTVVYVAVKLCFVKRKQTHTHLLCRRR